MTPSWTIILASQSHARRTLLESAGLQIETHPAALDEEAITQSLLAEGAKPRDIATALSEAKAARIAARFEGEKTLVIGADQVLALEGQIFHKPATVAEARVQLQALRGRTHSLLSTACLARNGSVIWRHSDEAELTMRSWSDAFIDDYLNRTGSHVCQSVGAYQIEGLGIQLFSKISGSHFTILGLPLLQLLEALRIQGALDS